MRATFPKRAGPPGNPASGSSYFRRGCFPPCEGATVSFSPLPPLRTHSEPSLERFDHPLVYLTRSPALLMRLVASLPFLPFPNNNYPNSIKFRLPLSVDILPIALSFDHHPTRIDYIGAQSRCRRRLLRRIKKLVDSEGEGLCGQEVFSSSPTSIWTSVAHFDGRTKGGRGLQIFNRVTWARQTNGFSSTTSIHPLAASVVID